jgi:hypothetical protein
VGHRCSIELPDGGSCTVDLDRDVALALAEATGRAPEDAWIVAVGEALAREPGWLPGYGRDERRPALAVRPGEAAMYHASSSANRASIGTHGLDWTRMGAAPGIAGSRRPEVPAVFLCDDRESAEWFIRMATDTTYQPIVEAADIWRVDARGVWIESGPDGWWMAFQAFAADRVRLATEARASAVGTSQAAITSDADGRHR